MPKERFFFDQPLIKGEMISLTDVEFHHLINVMRVKVGDEIEVVNGQGELASATLESIQKKQATLIVKEVLFEPKKPFSTILAQSIPRPNRLDFILEKATELGVSEIWLFPGKNSERGTLTKNQLDRSVAITIAAMKQSGRLYLPKIILKEELKKWAPFTLPAFYGDVDHHAPLFLDVWQKKKDDSGIIFFIGPEAGFTPNEMTELKMRQALGVHLNPHILRTDTAAITALSLITHRA